MYHKIWAAIRQTTIEVNALTMTGEITEPNAYPGVDVLEMMSGATRYNRWLLDIISENLGQTKQVLDFGAGLGTFSVGLRERGFDVSCLEPDEILRNQLEASGLTVKVDIQEIPDCSLSYVIALNVLEHIPNDHEVVCQLYSKIRPGGRLLVYVPAFQLLFSGFDSRVGHLRRYRRPQLELFLKLAGFHVEQILYVDSLGFFAALIYKFLKSNSGNPTARSIALYDRFIFPLSLRLDSTLGLFVGKNVLAVAAKKT